MKNYYFVITFITLIIGCQSKVYDLDYYVRNVNVIDVELGLSIGIKNVGIKDNTIIEVFDKTTKLSDETIVIDGSDKYLIPGLWDMHAHYSFSHTFSNNLLIGNGVVGIREMWGITDTIKKVKDETNKNVKIAPDIFSSGRLLDGYPPVWPGSAILKTKDDVLIEINEQVNNGVDFLKVYAHLDKQAYFEIARLSRELEIPFAGHVPNDVSIWDAIATQQHSVEHLTGLLEASSSQELEVRKALKTNPYGSDLSDLLVDTFNRKKFDSLAQVLARSNTWVCPTLTVLRSTANLDDSNFKLDQRLSYIPSFMQHMWEPGNDLRFKDRGEDFYNSRRRLFELQMSLVGELSKKGVKILAGTDFPNPYCFPGFSLHDELQLMVAGGMSPADALRTATYNPALFMGKENRYGNIKKGMIASFLILGRVNTILKHPL